MLLLLVPPPTPHPFYARTIGRHPIFPPPSFRMSRLAQPAHIRAALFFPSFRYGITLVRCLFLLPGLSVLLSRVCFSFHFSVFFGRYRTLATSFARCRLGLPATFRSCVVFSISIQHFFSSSSMHETNVTDQSKSMSFLHEQLSPGGSLFSGRLRSLSLVSFFHLSDACRWGPVVFFTLIVTLTHSRFFPLKKHFLTLSGSVSWAKSRLLVCLDAHSFCRSSFLFAWHFLAGIGKSKRGRTPSRMLEVLFPPFLSPLPRHF